MEGVEVDAGVDAVWGDEADVVDGAVGVDDVKDGDIGGLGV